jgi:mono/diheme cytochrome c family protein
MCTRMLALAAILGATASQAHAQEAGDPAKGLDYAKHVCAECHAVLKKDKFSPNPKAPGFQEIADTPGTTGISLAATLHSVHENMPNFTLAADERDNVIAYILSLKQER